MKPFAAIAALLAALAWAGPAAARDAFVEDGAALFSAQQVSALNSEIGDFNRQTGKEIVVVTVPSLEGKSIQSAAEDAFARNQVNGVLIFLAKAEKKNGIIGDRLSRRFFPQGSFASIRQAMRGYFRTGDFDTGIKTGVDLVLAQYRSHEGALGRSRRVSVAGERQLAPTSSQSAGGFHMGWFWWLVILVAGFLIVRAVIRAISAPKVYPPGYGGPMTPGMGGPGYGAPGYGPGGYGGGGGGFWSGLMGGLGGAFIGNQLFGNHGNIGGGEAGSAGVTDTLRSPHDGTRNIGGGEAGSAGVGDSYGAQDASGWQSDAGQADTSNASFGDYGDSGGGFDAGGGGFDGGGGGDGGW